MYARNTALYRSRDGGKTFVPIQGAPGGDDYHDVDAAAGLLASTATISKPPTRTSPR